MSCTDKAVRQDESIRAMRRMLTKPAVYMPVQNKKSRYNAGTHSIIVYI